MPVIRAPEECRLSGPALFLAGGITGCPPWQRQLIESLGDTSWILLDPRREWWPNDPRVVEQQIEWEHRHLRRADLIAFWFPRETLCPITLYELGAWSMTSKPLVVGVHPAFGRRFDVDTQTRLVRPDVPVVSSLDALAAVLREKMKEATRS
jgi:hypothetical protein